MNVQGRPTRPEIAAASAGETFTGNRGLDIEEALIFESGRFDATGVDIDEPPSFQSRLGPHARQSGIDLPGLTEPEAIRHYVRLSRNNYSIDAGLYPLGSCTMKHNPRLNEKMARLPGLRGRPSAAAGFDRARGARDHRGLVQRASDDDRHGGDRDVAKGRRAWRTLRHDGDQGRDRGARGGGDAPRRAGAGFRPWHESGDRRADRLFGALDTGGRGRDRQRRGGAGGARARCRGDHADQSQHLRTVRARDRRHRRRRSRGGRLFLLRRREFQRHRRQDASGRPRRRRHAHQPAQDLLDPAWRRRPRRGPGRAVGAACALRAGSLRQCAKAERSVWSSTWRGGAIVRAHVRLPRADGDVRARAVASFFRTARMGSGRPRKTRCSPPTTSALRSTI